MRVIVAGGRWLCPTEPLIVKCMEVLGRIGATCILCGDCNGGDMIGLEAGKRMNITIEHYPADWDKLGRAAGPIRNQQMVDVADALVAFPGGIGTADVSARARAKKIPVYRYKDPY